MSDKKNLWWEDELYTHPFFEAKERSEGKEWYKSSNLNEKCRDAIDQAIKKNYDPVYGKLKSGAVNPVIEKYGAERIAFVLAHTLNDSLWDGRVSLNNRSWVVEVNAYFKDLDYETGFNLHLTSPANALDKFVDQFQKKRGFDPWLELIETGKEPYPFIYRYSYNSAKLTDELPQYLWSWRLNCKCSEFIERAISISDMQEQAFSDLIEIFGPERVAYVLAATVDIFRNNSSISKENKMWLDDFGYHPADASVLESDGYLLNVTPSDLNSFLDKGLTVLKGYLSIPRTQEGDAINGNTEPGSCQYAIYQIDNLQCGYRFEGSEFLMEHNIQVNPADYKFVYNGVRKPMHTEREALDALFYKFNSDRPRDFRGSSLSVSDVIVLNHDYVQRAYYIDSTGYMPVPDFVEGRRDILENPALDPNHKAPELVGPSR